MAVGDIIYFNDGGEKQGTIVDITEQVPNSGNFNQIISSNAVLAVGEANLVNRFRVAKIIKQKKYNTRNVQEYEFVWKPLCMGFWNVDHAICGANARWEWQLLPFLNYPQRALESAYGTSISINTGALGSYVFQVKDFRLYLKTCKGPKIEKIEYYIDMNKVKAHTKTLTTNTTKQTTIDIQPSTYALGWCLQDSRVGNSTGFSASIFKHNNSEERRLQRYI